MGRARDRASADLNGQEFILDADADTSISADTDDQIDIKIAGADDFQFTANTFTVLSGSTIVVDDTTDSTSTTTGSIQTDGGLGVAKDVVVGDDILLKSDSAAIQFGADSEITLTHSADAGLSLRTSASTGPVLNIGTTSTSVSDGGFIGGIMFDAGSSNTATARIQALSNGTDEGGADFSFECRDSGASFNEKMRIGGEGDVTINVGDLLFGGSGKGVNLGVTSNTDSNTLDDYEEGAWTLGDASGGVSFAQEDGYYIKIGRQVHAYAFVNFPTTSHSGVVQINGLPFTIANEDAARGGGNISFQDASASNNITVIGVKNTQQIEFFGGTGANFVNSNFSAKSIYFAIHYYTAA